MLWACLRFPELMLDAVHPAASAGGASRDAMPLAIVDGPAPRRRIVLANDAARAGGVRAGQPLAAAQAVCPRLTPWPRDGAAERRLLETLATFAYRFSADVVIAAPDAVLIEIGASLKLFGGWPALERRLRAELSALGFRHAIAAAPTAAGARVLADVADGCAIFSAAPLQNALGDIPLVESRLDASVVDALYGMGFRRLHEVFRLPRAELARRIGPDALAHLDRLRGFVAESLPRYRPPERFERRIELMHGIESSAVLLFPLQRLLRELALFLVARDGGVQRFTMVLGHERQATTRIEVGLLAPEREAASLIDLARARLERVELPAAVHALTLLADDLPPLCPLHRDLFDSARREVLDWPALAERLRARLGDDSLHGLACVADHRPERAWRFVAPVARESGAGDRITPAATQSAGDSFSAQTRRPFWLLPRPLPLRPAPADVLAGPERIESGWWDGDDACRDYYVVRMSSGQRAWAFLPSGAHSGWMLHGWFA